MGWQRNVLKLAFDESTDFAGLEVVMRRPSIAVLLDLERITNTEVKSEAEAAIRYLELCVRLAGGLIRWNVDDEETGEPVPVHCTCAAEGSASHVEDCARVLALYGRDMDMINQIAVAWQRAVWEVSPPLGNGSTSGESSGEVSIPMEISYPSPSS